MTPASRAALLRFLVLYGALYAAFGVQSPYLPALLGERGLGPEAIGLVLAAGTAVRLAAGPAAGRLADHLAAPRAVLAACAAAAGLGSLLYLAAQGIGPLLVVGLLHAAALAPLAPLSDALALGAAAPARGRGAGRRAFDYGWVRGAGSAAFILGSVLSGQAVAAFGLGIIVWLNAALLAGAALCATKVPQLVATPAAPVRGFSTKGGVAALLGSAMFRRVVVVAALILGSHALHDSFAVIRWREAGIGPGTSGLLWSESVAAEVIVFLLVGPRLLDRLGPGRAASLAAGAAALRWAVSATTAWLPAIALIQPLHGLTFALLHLAAMRLLAEIVPPPLAATGLALYGTVGVGAAITLMTLLSGPLYASIGPHAFWVMSALAAVAVPLALTLREPVAALDGTIPGARHY